MTESNKPKKSFLNLDSLKDLGEKIGVLKAGLRTSPQKLIPEDVSLDVELRVPATESLEHQSFDLIGKQDSHELESIVVTGENTVESVSLPSESVFDFNPEISESLSKLDLDFSEISLGVDLIESPVSKSEEVNEINEDLIPLVLEELNEIYPELNKSWSLYLSSPNQVTARDLARPLHSLKGLFGMSGAMPLREIAYRMEAYLNKAVDANTSFLTEPLSLDLVRLQKEVSLVFEVDLSSFDFSYDASSDVEVEEGVLENVSVSGQIESLAEPPVEGLLVSVSEDDLSEGFLDEAFWLVAAKETSPVVASEDNSSEDLVDDETFWLAAKEMPPVVASEDDLVEDSIEDKLLWLEQEASSAASSDGDSVEGLVRQDAVIESEDSVLSSLAVSGSDSVFSSTDSWLADLDLDELSNLDPIPLEVESETAQDVLIQEEDIVVTVKEEMSEHIPQALESFEGLKSGDRKMAEAFYRVVHSIKGNIGVVGGMNIRAMLHHLENLAEEVKSVGVRNPTILSQMEDLLNRSVERINKFLFGAPEPSSDGSQSSVSDVKVVVQTVRVNSELLENVTKEVNESSLIVSSLSENNVLLMQKLRDLDEYMAKISRMARDLEMQAETQIQSRKAQLAEKNEDFDPLEMDRFTLFQEFSRLLLEGVSDAQDLQREMVRITSDQTTQLVYQGRSIAEVQEGLDKTLLVSIDKTINDRLHRTVLSAAKDAKKQVEFSLVGGSNVMDRSRLEDVVSPLSHIIRNSVAHGIETPEDRIKAGKSATGSIQLAVSKSAGRVVFVVEDDGAGLNVERIKKKAVEKGLWEANVPMDDKDAANIICMPNFSTAEDVTELSGRGVGMDVVRNGVLSMGGRFEIASRPGRGLRVVIQLPTSVSTASVIIVGAGNERFSVPIDLMDDVAIIRGDNLALARKNGYVSVGGTRMQFTSLTNLMGIPPKISPVKKESAEIMLLREGNRRVAIEIDKLIQISEVPLRPLSKVWQNNPGIIGATLLPDGVASFLVDPMRMPWSVGGGVERDGNEGVAVSAKPVVLIVDDSITVRKVTSQFLERNGYEFLTAKNGLEALEVLATTIPTVMFLDVEMPKMDGFDCAKNVRENPRSKDLPIIMITSRSAEKHRERAFSLGVNEYLGKPFNEDEVLKLLNKYAPKNKI